MSDKSSQLLSGSQAPVNWSRLAGPQTVTLMGTVDFPPTFEIQAVNGFRQLNLTISADLADKRLADFTHEDVADQIRRSINATRESFGLGPVDRQDFDPMMVSDLASEGLDKIAQRYRLDEVSRKVKITTTTDPVLGTSAEKTVNITIRGSDAGKPLLRLSRSDVLAQIVRQVEAESGRRVEPQAFVALAKSFHEQIRNELTADWEAGKAAVETIEENGLLANVRGVVNGKAVTRRVLIRPIYLAKIASSSDEQLEAQARAALGDESKSFGEAAIGAAAREWRQQIDLYNFYRPV